MDKKASIYNAFATINESFGAILVSLRILQEEGAITSHYLQQQTELTEELRAGMNHCVLNTRQQNEAEDWHHFGHMRETTEKKLRGEELSGDLPPSSTAK